MNEESNDPESLKIPDILEALQKARHMVSYTKQKPYMYKHQVKFMAPFYDQTPEEFEKTLIDSGWDVVELITLPDIFKDEERKFNWSEYFGEWYNVSVQDEFDILRKRVKMSGVQYRRLKHLEMHLDRGDIMCICEGSERASHEH